MVAIAAATRALDSAVRLLLPGPHPLRPAPSRGRSHGRRRRHSARHWRGTASSALASASSNNRAAKLDGAGVEPMPATALLRATDAMPSGADDATSTGEGWQLWGRPKRVARQAANVKKSPAVIKKIDAPQPKRVVAPDTTRNSHGADNVNCKKKDEDGCRRQGPCRQEIQGQSQHPAQPGALSTVVVRGRHPRTA